MARSCTYTGFAVRPVSSFGSGGSVLGRHRLTPPHVSLLLSQPGTRPGIRPVIRKTTDGGPVTALPLSCCLSVVKQLQKLDRIAQKKIVLAVAKLADNPRPHGVKSLTTRPGETVSASATTAWCTRSTTIISSSSWSLWLTAARSTEATRG